MLQKLKKNTWYRLSNNAKVMVKWSVVFGVITLVMYVVQNGMLVSYNSTAAMGATDPLVKALYHNLLVNTGIMTFMYACVTAVIGYCGCKELD